MVEKNILWLFTIVVMIITMGCSKDEKSDEKVLISFSIPNQTCDVTIDGRNVIVDMYQYVDLSKLTPIMVISDGATVKPASGVMVDFTNPVFYIVTAQNGSVMTYVVTVQKTLSRKNDIESFQLVGTEQIFEREGDDIFIYVPYETDIASIATEIIVSDKATITPESGVQKDFSNPQIYTVKSSDGTEKDFLVTVKRSPWRNVIKNGEAPFLKTDGHQLIVFKDKMWLLGGWLGKHNHNEATHSVGANYWTSQVWCMSDGINWESKGNAPWKGRHGFGCVVFDQRLWVLAGDDHLDIWNTEDGINWTKVIDVVPWGARYFPYIAVFNDKIWVLGGQDVDADGKKGEKYTDIWSSVDGINWVKEVQFAAWLPRATICGTVVLNNTMYLYGGGAFADGGGVLNGFSGVFNDVWNSSDGINWARIMIRAPWSPKIWGIVGTHKNHMFMMGGDSEGLNWQLSNDAWYSDWGVDWKQIKHSFWEPRHAASAVSFNDKLWLVGGLISTEDGGDTTNDVWVLDENYEQ